MYHILLHQSAWDINTLHPWSLFWRRTSPWWWLSQLVDITKDEMEMCRGNFLSCACCIDNMTGKDYMENMEWVAEETLVSKSRMWRQDLQHYCHLLLSKPWKPIRKKKCQQLLHLYECVIWFCIDFFWSSLCCKHCLERIRTCLSES